MCVCVSQYERLFDTTRVPGRSGDTIEHYDVDLERYIAVCRKGVWYKVALIPVVSQSFPLCFQADSLLSQSCRVCSQSDPH